MSSYVVTSLNPRCVKIAKNFFLISSGYIPSSAEGKTRIIYMIFSLNKCCKAKYFIHVLGFLTFENWWLVIVVKTSAAVRSGSILASVVLIVTKRSIHKVVLVLCLSPSFMMVVLLEANILELNASVKMTFVLRRLIHRGMIISE